MLKLKIQNLALKLVVSVGLVLFLSIFIWSHFSIRFQERNLYQKAVSDADKFCNTVLNFTWFAMLHNTNKDMRSVLGTLSDYNEIERIRLFDTHGSISFSNRTEEIETVAKQTDEACKTCHSNDTPVIKKKLSDRTRVFKSEDGELLLGIIHPILNEPGCSSAECHYHPQNVKKLGTLDVVVSLKEMTNAVKFAKKLSAWTAVYLFVILGMTISFFCYKMVKNPIASLIRETDRIGKGDYSQTKNMVVQRDEIGKLGAAIRDMGKKIKRKQDELNDQKIRYQNLFDQVPCTITVQNRDYKLLEFNREFSRKFNLRYGDHCFAAYKNRDCKCDDCPVERTFIDGKSHFSEESGYARDGTPTHWFVKTAPLKDDQGNIVAAVEMSIDISRRKKLEEVAKDSEQKYQAIFKSIPNPVFILRMDDFLILTCNDSASAVYGYSKQELEKQLFGILFPDEKSFDSFRDQILCPFHERLVHTRKDGEYIFVNIWVRQASFSDIDVLLVTIVDITQSVETEHQLIQAGKMATLGEMATGVAHELNQPLSVIKTASSFIAAKIKKNEPIDTDILSALTQEIESHVDRAAKITNHMRLFGRKSMLSKEEVNLNETIRRGFDIFSQQLKLREIEVRWILDDDLPSILADPVRLEQVFINLLINARDAIVERASGSDDKVKKEIRITTTHDEQSVTVVIADTGVGIGDSAMNKIFEPFYTTKEVGKGTGLGLSISYGIIKESGGEIRVGNNESGGATFTIRFKRNRQQS